MTRFKNLRSKAISLLEKDHNHTEFLKYFKGETEKLLGDKEFWNAAIDSIVFISRLGMFDYYHLPIDTEEYVSVDEYFHLAPLAGISDELGSIHILNLSLHNPELFEADAYDMRKLDIGLPADSQSALNIDEMHQRSLQFSSVRGGAGAMYHGHGAGKDTGENENTQFFRIVDHIINLNTNTKLPLLLAGIPSELTTYRMLSNYPNIMTTQVNNEHKDAKSSDALYEQARLKAREEITGSVRDDVVAQFEKLQSDNQRISHSLKDIKSAASEGRIQSLLLQMRDRTNDTIKDGIHEVDKLVFGSSDDSWQQIGRDVITHGGVIYNLLASKMPNGAPLVSVNRY